MPYTVICSERRLVNDKGEITRAACDWKFSGGWKVLGLVRRNNFGAVVEYIPFERWPGTLANIQWKYKNGKPRYTMRDWDHGTHREWGEMVQQVYTNTAGE